MIPMLRCMASLAASIAFFDPALAQPSMLCPGATRPLDISFASKPFVRGNNGPVAIPLLRDREESTKWPPAFTGDKQLVGNRPQRCP
jgi:hypothetical protein